MEQGFCIIEKVATDPGQPSDFRYVATNPAFERHTGLRDVIGKTILEALPAAEQAIMDRCDEVAATGVAQHFEARVESLDLWIDAEVFATGEPNQIAMLFSNVTERKRAEQALLESEEQLRLIVESARDYAIFTTDPHNIINKWLPGAQAVFGWTKDEAEGRAGDILFTPEDRERGEPQKEIETARTRGQSPDVRWHLHKDGHRVFIEGEVVPLRDPAGGVRGFLKIGRDATDKRANEEALRQGEERFRAFGEASSDILWMRDADTLGWTYLTPAFEPIYGLTRERALAGDNFANWAEMILPEDLPHALDSIHRVRNGERVDFEYRIRRPDGTVRWMRDTDFPILDDTGRVASFGGIGQDITALKAAEDHQRTLLAELQHRVRNTLAVVRSIARRTAESSDSADDMLAHFQGRLDAFSRVQAALTRNPDARVDLASIIEDELVAHAAREGEDVSLSGPEIALPPRTAEGLSLAVHELTTNAVKHGAFSSESGRLAISWHVEAEDGADWLLFDWTESGASVDASPPERKGFGMQLLERSLPYDLQAETSVEFAPEGLRFSLKMPLPGR